MVFWQEVEGSMIKDVNESNIKIAFYFNNWKSQSIHIKCALPADEAVDSLSESYFLRVDQLSST
jgi:hypothetical protein